MKIGDQTPPPGMTITPIVSKVHQRRIAKAAAKAKPRVVAQFDYAAVKQAPRGEGQPDSFDVWQWNIFKMKWVRLANTACGFGSLADAKPCAKEISDEIAAAILNNQHPPKPL
jgi:hypothetical protein